MTLPELEAAEDAAWGAWCAANAIAKETLAPLWSAWLEANNQVERAKLMKEISAPKEPTI